MAAILPSQLIPNYTFSNGIAGSNISGLSGLDAQEADEITGDGREVVRAIIETIASSFLALPVAERPARMNVTKSNPVGTGINQISQSYTFTFGLTIDQSEADLQDEPA